MVDHYPFVTIPAPGTPIPSPSRYIKFGDLMICTSCQLAAAYCKCAMQPPAAVGSNDAAESSLEKRARACKESK